MIIVQLLGGLGNQMFQYSAGRSLSEKLKVPLKLDIFSFETAQVFTKRHYELSCFNIKENFATKNEINWVTKNIKGLRRLYNFIDKDKPYYKKRIFYEQENHKFDTNFFNANKDVYLIGYWQTEKYFKDIENIIRNEFTIKYEQDSKNREIADKIQNTNSVSIHIRRTDYVIDPTTNKYHGVCSLDYYNNCVEYIATRISNPHFFAFSDDINWVIENLKLNYPITYITHNGEDKKYEDMRLMSLCKHNIIANSSFSWWGAWLNKNPEKIVLAPKRWLQEKETPDLIPSNWIRV